MRIQHNIPAMSAYRNYTANVSAVQKNLEKLSSGYRINRAGDDAAGLAISEKMRAQISGLEQAQSNAKSGINLVQTGEGALTEVHDMLNRMYTLAEQSANGTYDNEVDRYQLQKEVQSLRDEINRIADSTNFNGIKLLDGSLDNGAAAAVKGVTSNFKIGGTGAGALPTVDDNKINNGGTVLHKAAGGGDVNETSFGIAFHNTQITGDKGDTFTLTIGDKTLTGTLLENAGKGAELGADEIIKALTGGTGAKISFGDDYDPAALTIGGAKYTVTADGTENVKVTLNDGETVPANVAFDITLAKGTDTTTPAAQAPSVNAIDGTAAGAEPTVNGALTVSGVNGVAATPTKGTITVDFTNITLAAGASKLTLTVGGQTVESAAIAEADKADAAKIAAAFAGKTITFGGQQMTAAVDATDNKKLIFTQDTAADANLTGVNTGTLAGTATTATAGTVEVDFGTKTGAEVIGSSITVDGVTYEFVKTGGTATITGATAVAVDEDATPDDLADALVTAAGTTKGGNVQAVAEDGADTKKVVFTANGTGADSKLEATETSTETVEVDVLGQRNWKATDQKVKADATGVQLAQTSFDLTADMAADGASIRIGDTTYTFTTDTTKTDTADTKYVKFAEGDALAKIAEKLTAAAADNTTYSVAQKGANITLTEQTNYTTGNQKYDLSTKEGIEESLGFTTAGTKASAGNPDEGLTLQIGDTAESFNKLTVSIKDMHADAMGIGEGAVDISTQEGASKAMDAIKNAINYVSDARGTLGALQNRLDHTINNLSVAQENIQDAESTIRDVDIAQEMMAYTKNNILVQSAQAMLAQANQLPQGVLQLLG